MASLHLPTELKDFLPLSKLGQGAFSTVYKVKRINDNQVYALKKIKIQKLSQKQKANALNQIRILASIKSNYIISYKQAFYDQSLNLLCIVMEYANGGDLQKKITDNKKSCTKFQQNEIWRAASEILVGLHVLHQRGILHRDLKSANVFVSNQQYKLGDLNVSKVNDEKDQMARTQTGTPYYASPQVWRDQPYDSKCDIWSFGCLIYEICCFEPPFQGNDLEELYKNVQRGRYKQIPRIYSQELGSLIKFCLQVNPRQRPSALQLFKKFRKLNEKYNQCLKVHQFQSANKLINTIQLPSDMKQLSKNLPLPEYQTNVKDEPQTMYGAYEQNKQTVLLKSKPPVETSQQKVMPLPQRIKKYFQNAKNIEVVKRPQRPRTTSKQKSKKEGQNHLRPSSAYEKKIITPEENDKFNLFEKNKLKEARVRTDNQALGIIQRDKCIIPQNREIKPLPSLSKPPIYNPSQYRCKSSQSNRNQRVIEQISSPKENLIQNYHYIHRKNVFSSQKNTKNSSSIQQASSVDPALQENFSLNKKLYQNCKENSLKKISSLQKKVKYIRDQRRQRKVFIEKNKQNLCSIFKQQVSNQERLDMKQCLREKIKQNSEVFRCKAYEKGCLQMPIIRQNVNEGQLINKEGQKQKRDVLKVILQKRKEHMGNRRYIASADSKRVRSYTQASNEQSSKQNAPYYGIGGIIKKKPTRLYMESNIANKRVINSISSNINNSKANNNHTNITRSIYSREQRKQQENMSMIDDSEMVLRLKKRIKSRMIGNGNGNGEIRNKVWDYHNNNK